MKSLSCPAIRGAIAATAILCAVQTGLTSAALAEDAPAQTAAKATQTAAKAALTVSVTQAVPNEWPQLLAANGNIAAWQEAVIGAEAGGLRLEEVRVNVGDRVKKGQLLARLQSDTLRADLDQTRASFKEAEASLAEATANADRARRLQPSGMITGQQATQWLTAEQTARARLAVFKAKIRADEVRLTQTEIKAPANGAVSARLATIGAVVQPGQELFRLILDERLEWRAEIPAAELARLQPGMAATVFTPSGAKAPGTIRMVAPTVDPQTRNGLVYVDISEAHDARAGMFARGEIALGKSGALTLPQSSVQMRDGFHYVFRLGADNKVVQTKVTVGRRSGDRIEIVSGIDATQKIVADGVGFLVDGDTVRVVAPPQPNGKAS
ncbi:MAG: efflux RND transporter periplasmic adaptor subunit [Propionivibrio sp.]